MLLTLFGVIWLALAVSPVNRQDWFLENLLVFAAVPILLGTYSRFRLSNGSYFLIALFLVLHAVGAHYTYSAVPAGDWLRERFSLGRNHYDRLVHFAFGVLLTFPVWDSLTRKVQVPAPGSYWIAVCVILACSGLYEILEALVAVIVDPGLGAAYTGTQGDEWDSQKDMALALAGTLIAMCILVLRVRRSRSHPSQSGRERPLHDQ